MTLHKNKRIYYIAVSAFSALALFLHMAALKLIYNSIGLLLEANEASHKVRDEIAIQVDNLKRYSNNCTNLFYLVSYLFLIFIGIMLITRKIKLKTYLLGFLLFEIIQVAGLSLFIQIFNKYGLTEGFGRLRVILRHELFWAMLIIPIIICLGHGLIKKQIHKSR